MLPFAFTSSFPLPLNLKCPLLHSRSFLLGHPSLSKHTVTSPRTPLSATLQPSSPTPTRRPQARHSPLLPLAAAFLTVFTSATPSRATPVPTPVSSSISSRPVVHNSPNLRVAAKPAAVRVARGGILPRRTDTLVHQCLKWALLAGIVTVVVTAITISIFWVIQDSLVYKPTRVWRGTPKSSGMPFYDDVSYCTIDGVEISGWFIKQPPDSFQNARTMIYFHGTDKNASFRLRKVIGFYEACNCNILLLSYRGYGLSTGKPNERGVRIDAESAYNYLNSRGDVDVSPNGNLWVYGESLGGAVAIHFSNVYQKCIKALILENTFTSLLDMIKLEFPILGIFRYLSRNRWQSKKRIGDLNIPLLFLSGLKDSYIPPAMMKQMHTLATKSPFKEFVEFEKGTHNRTWAMDGFYEAVATFMDRVESETKEKQSSEQPSFSSLTSRIDDTGRFSAA